MNNINSIDILSIPNIYLKQKKTKKTRKTRKTRNNKRKSRNNKRKSKNNKRKSKNNKRKSKIIKSQEKISSIFDRIEYLCSQLNKNVMNHQIRVILLFILETIFIKWIITENININHFFTEKSTKIILENGIDSLMKTLHNYGVELDDVIIKLDGEDGNIVDIKEKNMSVFIDESNKEYPSYTHVFEKLNIVYISGSNTKLYEVPENYSIECVNIFTGINDNISCKEYIQNKRIKKIISIFNEKKEKIYYTKNFYVISQELTKPILFIDIPKYYIFHNKDGKQVVCNSNVYNKIKFFTDELILTCIDEPSQYKVGGMLEEDSPPDKLDPLVRLLDEDEDKEFTPFTQKEVLKQPTVVEEKVVRLLDEDKEFTPFTQKEVLKQPTVVEEEETGIADESNFDEYFDTLFHKEIELLSQINPTKLSDDRTLILDEDEELFPSTQKEGEQQSKRRKCMSDLDEDDNTIAEPIIDFISLVSIEGIIQGFSKNPVILKIFGLLGLDPQTDSYKLSSFIPEPSVTIPNTQSIVDQEIVGNCWVFGYSRIINKYTQLINTIFSRKIGIPIPKTLDMTIENNKMYKHLSFKFLNMTYIIGTTDPATGRAIEGCINRSHNVTFAEIKTAIVSYHVRNGIQQDPTKILDDSTCFMNRLVNLMFHMVSFDSINFSSQAVSSGCNLTAQSRSTNTAIYCQRGGNIDNPIMHKYVELYITQVKDIPEVIAYCKTEIRKFYRTQPLISKMLIPLESLENNGYVELLSKSRRVQQEIYSRLSPNLRGTLIRLKKVPIRDRTNQLVYTSSDKGWTLEISGVPKTLHPPIPHHYVLSTPITSKTRSYRNYNLLEVVSLMKVLLLEGIYIELSCELNIALLGWQGLNFGGMTHLNHALVITKYTYDTTTKIGKFNIENSWKKKYQITEMLETDLLTFFENNRATISFILPGNAIDLDALINKEKQIWYVDVSVT
jgi:hypothetical protein